jgi:hypothetical protein
MIVQILKKHLKKFQKTFNTSLELWKFPLEIDLLNFLKLIKAMSSVHASVKTIIQQQTPSQKSFSEKFYRFHMHVFV